MNTARFSRKSQEGSAYCLAAHAAPGNLADSCAAFLLTQILKQKRQQYRIRLEHFTESDIAWLRDLKVRA